MHKARGESARARKIIASRQRAEGTARRARGRRAVVEEVVEEAAVEMEEVAYV